MRFYCDLYCAFKTIEELNMTSTNFRKDINGLRAIAVVSVVLFHFGVVGFSGGFVGVDVFFVISGFLMTGIVARGFEKKNFSFIIFYLARARRIIPALFFLAVVLLALGWFYLSPIDYTTLAREVDRSLLFLSNNYFYKKSGYFDPDSHERLLLHTWSLSIEWQFYILYPILLFAVSKISLNLTSKVIVALFVASLSYSVFKSHVEPSYAFYILPSRAWEMLLGGIVYYAARNERYKLYKDWCLYIGLAFVVLSIFVYSPATVWPGAAALLPTVGTALIIYAGKDSFLISNVVSQRLGDWSYSIYLWHWPLVASVLLFDIEKTNLITVSLISLSIVLGALSYYCIENPVRRFLTVDNHLFVFLLIIIPLVSVFAFAKSIRENKGFIDRVPEDAFVIFDQANNKFHELDKCQKKRKNEDCIYGNGELGVIVIGDSHAMSIIGSIVTSLDNNTVLDWSHSGCPTIDGVKYTGDKPDRCNNFLSPRLGRLSAYAGVPILVSNRFSAHLLGSNESSNSAQAPALYLTQPYQQFSDSYIDEISQGYIKTFCALAENNPVYILKPTPELKLHVPNIMGRSLLLNGKDKRVSISMSEHAERNQAAFRLLDKVAKQCDITLLDPIHYLCDSERCHGDINGLPIFYDDDHLNVRGADSLKPLFEQMFLNK